MRRTLGLISAVAVAASTLLATPAGAAPVAPAAVSAPSSIGAVRGQPLGSTVTVAGTVSTPSGAFESSFYDKGFAVQDATAGIYISAPFATTFRVGDQVRVSGILADHSGLLVIEPAAAGSIVRRGGVRPVNPRYYQTGDIGEGSEGRIVTTIARVASAPVSDAPYGQKFTVDDGSGELVIFVNVETGISLSGISQDDWVIVSGFSSQYSDHYEIDPRFQADIIDL